MPASKTRTKRIDCLTTRIKIDIPIDMHDGQSYPNAVKAIIAIKTGLPAGSTVEAISSAFGKMEAPSGDDIPAFLKRTA